MHHRFNLFTQIVVLVAKFQSSEMCIRDRCLEYLDKLNEIAYQEDYIVSYVQGVFSKLNATTIDSNSGESLNLSLIHILRMQL